MIAAQFSRFKKVLAFALLVALTALLAMPVSSSHTCVQGTDDYNQCVSQTAGDEPQDVGSEPGIPWYEDNCEDGACR